MRCLRSVLIVVAPVLSASALAQESPARPTGQESLAATMGVYVYPTSDEPSRDQNADETACYSWAVQNTGSDPFELSKQAQADQQGAAAAMQQTEQIGKGAGARGAVKGAAVGALIGEVASDDAGSGAAWGAGLGAVHHRRRSRRATYDAQAEIAAGAVVAGADTDQQIEDFKKAFSVCLEAKDYLVKY